MQATTHECTAINRRLSCTFNVVPCVYRQSKLPINWAHWPDSPFFKNTMQEVRSTIRFATLAKGNFSRNNFARTVWLLLFFSKFIKNEKQKSHLHTHTIKLVAD